MHTCSNKSTLQKNAFHRRPQQFRERGRRLRLHVMLRPPIATSCRPRVGLCRCRRRKASKCRSIRFSSPRRVAANANLRTRVDNFRFFCRQWLFASCWKWRRRNRGPEIGAADATGLVGVSGTLTLLGESPGCPQTPLADRGPLRGRPAQLPAPPRRQVVLAKRVAR